MAADDTTGAFDYRPWRRKQLLVSSGSAAVVLGLAIYMVSQWGSICSDDTTCWGNGEGTAAPVAVGGLVIAIIGLAVLITGKVMRAPLQVTLVPDGEVSLSRTRVMLPEAWEGHRVPIIIGGREVRCDTGDTLLIGDTSYTVIAIDRTRNWVTLRPVPDEPGASPA